MRHLEPFAVPLIQMIGEGAENPALIHLLDAVVADLDAAVPATVDPGAELLGQHLRPEADAKEGLALLQRDPDPVGLLLDVVEIVVGALGAAEDHGPAMMLERFGQRLAVEMAAYVEGVTIALNHWPMWPGFERT